MAATATSPADVVYETFKDAAELPDIMALMEKDLSEPYTVFTYRYFIDNWPQYCWLARLGGKLVGAIVARESPVPQTADDYVGYVAMLAVDKSLRRMGIGKQLVVRAIESMRESCFAVELEAENTNAGALRLYERLGFIRMNRMKRYYLHGTDAFRLKLVLREPKWPKSAETIPRASPPASDTPADGKAGDDEAAVAGAGGVVAVAE